MWPPPVRCLQADCACSCRLGNHFPTHIHSRDAATPNWGTPNPDGNTFCGAIVSGPCANPGPTDLFTDDRTKYQEAEAGIDYSGSVICAFGGYADQPSGAFDHCSGVRSPLTART
jgi:Glycosyl hydrolase family 9